MVAQRLSTAKVARNEYLNYLEKALEFYSVMTICLQDKEWDSVLLLGVHSAIGLCDALTVFHGGVRSVGQDHRDAVNLLSQTLSSKEGVGQNVKRLSAIINEKNKVSYEPKRFHEKEARSFAQLVERFMEWGRKLLP